MTPAVVSVHHHLRPGGVSTVIAHTGRILGAAGGPHLVLSRATPGLESLDYDENRRRDLAPALTRSLAVLAGAGEAMILQHHDLAEDARPRNLEVLRSVPVPYPVSPRLAHAFLNRRDLDAFTGAGLAEDQAVLLPNPIVPRPPSPPPPDGAPVVLMPMRGIPRKNLGEFLLLAAAAPTGARFLQGSAPEQENWRPAYDAWRRFAESHSLPVVFDVFRDRRPEACIDRATHLVTTSTREGFGMIHAEAAGRRRVIGRRIPYLDLEGFPTDGLYDALVIDGRDFGHLDDEAQRARLLAFARGEIDVAVEQRGRMTPLRAWLRGQLDDRQPRDASVALARHSPESHLRRLLDLRDRLLAAPQSPVGQLDPELIARAFP